MRLSSGNLVCLSFPSVTSSLEHSVSGSALVAKLRRKDGRKLIYSALRSKNFIFPFRTGKTGLFPASFVDKI